MTSSIWNQNVTVKNAWVSSGRGELAPDRRLATPVRTIGMMVSVIPEEAIDPAAWNRR